MISGARPQHMPVGAAAAGPYDPHWPYPCASCLRRRGLGLAVSGHSQSAPPTAPGKAPHRAPGHQLAGPGLALPTLAPTHGQRQPGPSRRGRHRLGMECFRWAMAQHMAVPPQASRRLLVAAKGLQAAHVHRTRRSPGVVEPSAALRGCYRILEPRQRQEPDGGKEGGSPPTESRRLHRRIVLAPALPMHRGHKHHEDLKKSADHP
jgi:hypothetical protein